MLVAAETTPVSSAKTFIFPDTLVSLSGVGRG